jgi:4-amino-4-deoxy-L-arabinose transferase-like glycosyltransferase
VLYGEPFLTKPPGHYIAIILASLPQGAVTEVSARVPSVVGALTAIAALYLLLRRVTPAWLASVAAAATPVSLLWLDKVPSAEIDMTLTGWVTLALVAWYLAEPPLPAGTWRRLGLCIAAVSLAIATLTKWTAPAFFLATLLAWVWLGKRWWAYQRWEPMVALGLAGGVCLMWGAAVVHHVGYDQFWHTLHQEATYRLWPVTNKAGSWLTHAVFPWRVLAATLPLSLPAVVLLHPRYYGRLTPPARSLALFLHCWAWPNLLFWTLVPNHNVRYLLPITPAISGLGVLGIAALLQGQSQCWLTGRMRPYRLVYALMLLGLAVKLAWVEFVVPARTSRRNPVPIAEQLRQLIPEQAVLYVDKLKDDGVMFYYGRSVCRWRGSSPLTQGAYLALTSSEWDQWSQQGRVCLVQRLRDQQGDPLIVARWRPAAPGAN